MEIASHPAACHKAREMFSKVTPSSARTYACPECGAGLLGKPDRRAQVIACPGCGTKASVAEWTQGSAGHARLAGRPALSQNAGFSVEIPSDRRYLWTAAIVTCLVGSAFITAAATFLNDRPPHSGNDAPLPIRIFDSIFVVAGNGFQLIFALAGAALVIGSVILFINLFRTRGSVRKLEGNSAEIAIRTYRHNLIWKERTFPRAEVTDIRASQSGSSGGTIMKRLALISGERVIKLAGWIDGAAADAVVAEVRPAL